MSYSAVTFEAVILKAATARAEREAGYQNFRQARAQELADLARELDEREEDRRRVNWAEWLPYLQANMGASHFVLSDHISDQLGFYVSPHRISNAIQAHDLTGRKKKPRRVS